ncbi:MAG: hypothetical protein AB1772_07475 [Candidatus Zixiibacteriota bacterium]
MKRLRSNSGSALLVVLALMLLVSAVGIITIDTANTDIELSYNQLHEDQAFYVAEAGAKQALWAINDSNAWRDGYAEKSFGSGVYSVTLTDSLVDTLLFDTVIIRSTGEVQGSRTTIELTTVPVYRYPFRYAMFADAGIVLDRETCTDSYDSDSGTYAATVMDSLGDIGSNGTITSAQLVEFGGNVSVATPGGITLGAGNTVHGDTTSTADSVALDPVPSTEMDWARSNSIAQSGLSGVGYTYNNGTKTLTTGQSGTITMQSGVYYFSSITLGKNSSITLAPGANVRIYVAGNILFNQGSVFNATGTPSDALIFSTGTSLTFNQDNVFNGAFYGPDAHIQYDQTTQVFGALVGNTIKLDRFACFHYDRSLAKVTYGTTGEMIAVAWGETY